MFLIDITFSTSLRICSQFDQCSEIDYLVASDEKLKRVEKYLVWKTFKQQFLAENSILCVPLSNKLVDRHLGSCLPLADITPRTSILLVFILIIIWSLLWNSNSILLGKNIIWCEEIIRIVLSNYIFKLKIVKNTFTIA